MSHWLDYFLKHFLIVACRWQNWFFFLAKRVFFVLIVRLRWTFYLMSTPRDISIRHLLNSALLSILIQIGPSNPVEFTTAKKASKPNSFTFVTIDDIDYYWGRVLYLSSWSEIRREIKQNAIHSSARHIYHFYFPFKITLCRIFVWFLFLSYSNNRYANFQSSKWNGKTQKNNKNSKKGKRNTHKCCLKWST